MSTLSLGMSCLHSLLKSSIVCFFVRCFGLVSAPTESVCQIVTFKNSLKIHGGVAGAIPVGQQNDCRPYVIHIWNGSRPFVNNIKLDGQ